jgi:hypothetical protein
MVLDGNFFCDLIGHEDGYMNCLIDSNGKLIRFLNKYPKTDSQFDPIIGSNIFGANIEATPDMQKVITSYGYTDLIEIYNTEGKNQLQLYGPNYKNYK